MKTKSETTGREIDFEAKHIGLLVDDELWQHDAWLILLDGGREIVEYKTGIGHRIANKSLGGGCDFARVAGGNWKQDKENLIAVNKRLAACSRPKAPELDDILYSLVSDSSAADSTFADWCADFGYDTDSIKATEIYKACQNSAAKLRNIGFTDLDALRDQFQDY